MTGWVPVVDVSEYQGLIDWSKMPEHVIIRAGRGTDRDTVVDRNVLEARAAGRKVLALYWRLNPKVSGGGMQGAMLHDACTRLNVATPMLDVEGFAELPGTRQWSKGAQLVAWYSDAYDQAALSRGRPIVYTNANYWDDYVGTAVPRYAGSDLVAPHWVTKSPPVEPGAWEGVARAALPAGPRPPLGWSSYKGWQFSANGNGAGARYGAQSTDLDLNIVDPIAVRRWLGAPMTAPVSTLLAHTTNRRPRRKGDPRLISLHISATNASARNGATYYSHALTSPVSSHLCIDGVEVYRCVPDDQTAYTNTPWNDYTLTIEHQGVAQLTRADWLARGNLVDYSAEMVAGWAARFGIPLVWLDAPAIIDHVTRTGEVPTGVTSHVQLNRAAKALPMSWRTRVLGYASDGGDHTCPVALPTDVIIDRARGNVEPPVNPTDPPKPAVGPLPEPKDTDMAMRNEVVQLDGGDGAVWRSNGIQRFHLKTPMAVAQALLECGKWGPDEWAKFSLQSQGVDDERTQGFDMWSYVAKVGDLGGYGAPVEPV